MKRIMISFLTMLLILSTVIPLNADALEKIPLDGITSTETFTMDGQTITFEQENQNGVRKVTIKNEKGDILSQASSNIKTKETILDGVKLTNEQVKEITEFGEEELKNINNNNSLVSEPTDTISPLAANSCSYKKLGNTRYRSTWIPKTGVAAVAAAIAATAATPVLGPQIAWAIASVVAGSSNTLYYTVTEYGCSKNGWYYLKTTRSFYKNSNYTGHVYTFSVYGSRR